MKTQNTPFVEQLAPNQVIIKTDTATFFQSYNSIIVKIEYDKITLGKNWNYSKTTAKYRNQFLNETTKETESKIKTGQYIIDENL